MKYFEILILSIVFLLSVNTFAQDQNSVTAQVTPGTNHVETSNQVLSPVEQKMQKLVSVDFRNTPIEDVIRMLAQQADIDIVKSPSVTGNVTATLKNVPLGEALRNILAAQGYAYVADQHLIRVVTKAEISDQQESLVNKVYHVTYADVKEVEASLKKFISPRGSISANPGTNNIIVTDTESKIRAVDTFIDEIDRMTPQILVEARIYDITSKDRFDLGVDWQVGTNTGFDAKTGEFTGKTTPVAQGLFTGSGAKQAETAQGQLRLGYITNTVDIEAIFRAQQENIDAKLLANPRVLVLDNENAVIKIISEIPYLQLNQGVGISSFGTVEFKEVGVTLKVTPHLTREGMIRLKLQPEFSVQTGTANVGDPLSSGSTFPVPVIDKRQADTTLLVEDGQTVVLGGLRKKTVTKQINKIPCLGDLPVVGWLFKFTGESTVLSEIVVFVTPHVIEQTLKTGDMVPSEQKAFRNTEFQGPVPAMTEAEKAPEKCKK